MLAVFEFMKTFMHFSSIITDNMVFRMHYKFTALLLLFCSLMVSSRMIFGSPIQCLASGGVDINVLNSYCWIHSTFSVTGPRASIGRQGRDNVVLGVEPYVQDEDHIVTHKYYQWVAFVLIFQALCFYLPRYSIYLCLKH